ncbi:MAG TPA: cobalamin-dependent protein [Thermoanaerobaculia bacterium]|nr:cobalamin-dependent protein [Thermoanaerobaculia bacterium]
MEALSQAQRTALAARLVHLRQPVAEAVTEEFFRRHPEWAERYGPAGRERGVEDARYHMDFLGGALAAGEPRAFAEYVRWARRVLEARGIDARFLRENLEQIGAALASRLDGDAGLAVEELVRTGLAACDEPAGRAPADETPEMLAAERQLYLQAAMRGQRDAAMGIVVESHSAGHSVLDLYLRILQPAQYEIGRLWECNEISVAEEHMATAITQSVMARLYPLLPKQQLCRGRMLLTGVQGEMHQVGANMVADVLEFHGWEVRFLGTNLPQAGILRVIEEQRPDVVGISATMLFNLPRVRELIESIRALPIPQPRIVVGGAAFRTAADAWREVGADACGHDLEQAVGLLCVDEPG